MKVFRDVFLNCGLQSDPKYAMLMAAYENFFLRFCARDFVPA